MKGVDDVALYKLLHIIFDRLDAYGGDAINLLTHYGEYYFNPYRVRGTYQIIFSCINVENELKRKYVKKMEDIDRKRSWYEMTKRGINAFSKYIWQINQNTAEGIALKLAMNENVAELIRHHPKECKLMIKYIEGRKRGRIK